MSAMLDGQIDAAGRARIDAHIAACDACREVAAGLASARAALQAMPQVDAPRSFRISPEQVASRETAPTPRNNAPALRFAAAAVAAIVVVVIGVQVISNIGGGSDSSANRALSVQSADTPDRSTYSFAGSPAAAIAPEAATDSAAPAAGTPTDGSFSGAIAPPDTAQATPPAPSVANGAGEAASPPAPGPGVADNAASTSEAAPRAAAGTDKAASTPAAASPAPVSTDSGGGGNKAASPVVWIAVAVVLAVPIGAVAWRLRRRWTS